MNTCWMRRINRTKGEIRGRHVEEGDHDALKVIGLNIKDRNVLKEL